MTANVNQSLLDKQIELESQSSLVSAEKMLDQFKHAGPSLNSTLIPNSLKKCYKIWLKKLEETIEQDQNSTSECADGNELIDL